jgi:integrase
MTVRSWNTFFRWIRREKFPDFDPPVIEQLKATLEENRDYLTAEELRRVLLVSEGLLLNGEPVEPILSFLAYTGMRRGEALLAEWSWIRNGHISIPARVTKTGKGRTVPILKQAQAVLDRLPKSSTRLFPSMTVEIGRKFKKACMIAEIDRDLKLHNLRDTFCVSCILAGVPATIVAKWAGHDPVVMLKHYAAIGIEDTMQLVERAESGFK